MLEQFNAQVVDSATVPPLVSDTSVTTSLICAAFRGARTN